MNKILWVIPFVVFGLAMDASGDDALRKLEKPTKETQLPIPEAVKIPPPAISLPKPPPLGQPKAKAIPHATVMPKAVANPVVIPGVCPGEIELKLKAIAVVKQNGGDLAKFEANIPDDCDDKKTYYKLVIVQG